MGYNVPPSNDNKKKKSKTLVEILKKSGEEMPSPDKFSQETYDIIKAPTVRNNVLRAQNQEPVKGTVQYMSFRLTYEMHAISDDNCK